MSQHDDSPSITDTHQDLLRSETAVPASEAAWLKWIHDAEQITGHSLDGDQASGADPFSIDAAYKAWEDGASPAQYVASFQGESA